MKLLVPTDFSPYSDRALELADLIARKTKGEITLLNVIYDLRESPLFPTIVSGIVAESLEARRKENLTRLREIAETNPLIKMTIAEFGEAHRVILERGSSCDLIVMGTRGIHGLSGALVGSVTLRVLRKAVVPLITVREKVPNDIKKVVAATDTSEVSGKALNAAIALARAVGAEMIPVYIDTIARYVSEGKVYWQRVVERVSAISECKDCKIYQSDSPVRGIIEFSEREGADLITVGARGLSGIREVVGSTAIGVMSSASAPVMVV
ncbi:MAG: universal stress protein [candidate division WOR-3 bacterium]